MPGSNCCFLTCIQVLQEAGKMVWYSHLFKNFPVCWNPYLQRFTDALQPSLDQTRLCVYGNSQSIENSESRKGWLASLTRSKAQGVASEALLFGHWLAKHAPTAPRFCSSQPFLQISYIRIQDRKKFYHVWPSSCCSFKCYEGND